MCPLILSRCLICSLLSMGTVTETSWTCRYGFWAMSKALVTAFILASVLSPETNAIFILTLNTVDSVFILTFLPVRSAIHPRARSAMSGAHIASRYRTASGLIS